jgi:hypothetical protein
MRRTVLRLVSVCTLASLAGCATHEIHGDPALPEAERAVIEGYWRYPLLYFEELQIVSVDGKRQGAPSGLAYASSVSVPAGRHSLQVMVLRNNNAIALCAFEWTFEPKHHYKVQHIDHDQFLLAHPSVPRFPVSVSMDVTAPSIPARHVRAGAECGEARR